MSETIFGELALLGKSLAVGVALMVFYDGLRLFRILAVHGALWTGMEDFVYWAVSSLVTFLLLLHLNDGVVRWYAVGGVLAGMLVYNMTISRIYLHLLKKAEKYFTIKKMRRKEKRKLRRERRSLRRERQNRGREQRKRRRKKREEVRGNGEKAKQRPPAAVSDAGKWPSPAGQSAGPQEKERKPE